MNTLIVFLTIIFISLIGFVTIRSCGILQKKDVLLTLACSYGLGIGLIVAQLFIYSFVNIPWNRISVLIFWVIVIVVMNKLNRAAFIFSIPRFVPLKKIETLFIVFILLAVGYTTFEALIRPVMVWDGWAMWVFNANVFYMDGKVAADTHRYLQTDYPLVVSLLDSFIYIFLGQIDDTAILLTSTAFYVFTGIALFGVIKNEYGFRYALLFTFLYTSTQNFIRHGGRVEAGIADLPLGYYFFLCTILMLNYIKHYSAKSLLLLSIFLGTTSLIKSEGLPFAIVIVLIIFFHIYKKKLYNHLPLLLFWLMPLIHWEILKKLHNVKAVYFSAHTFEISVNKTINSISGTFKELINLKSWGFLWIIYLYSFLFKEVKKKKVFIILNVIILSQLLLYLFLYIFTYGNEPESSIERLLIHIAPVVFYYLAILVKTIFPKFNFSHFN